MSTAVLLMLRRTLLRFVASIKTHLSGLKLTGTRLWNVVRVLLMSVSRGRKKTNRARDDAELNSGHSTLPPTAPAYISASRDYSPVVDEPRRRTNSGLTVVSRTDRDITVSGHRASVDDHLAVYGQPYQYTPTHSPGHSRNSSTASIHTTHVPLEGLPVPTMDTLGRPPNPRLSSPSLVHVVISDEDGDRYELDEMEMRDPCSQLRNASSVHCDPGGNPVLAAYPVHRPVSPSIEDRSPVEGTHNDAHLAGMNELATNDHLRFKGIIPIVPDEMNRYSRGHRIPVCSKQDAQVLPLRLDYNHKCPPEQWQRFIHPEGAVYYFNPNGNICTEADLCDSQDLEVIQEAISEIQDILEKARQMHMRIPHDVELVLDLPPTQEKATGVKCYYYFVNHANRSLFWLNQKDLSYALQEIASEATPTQMKTYLEAQYWSHWEYFPRDRQVTEELLQEVVGLMVFNAVDSLTSKTSTAGYTHETYGELIELIKNANYFEKVGGYSATIVGRLMSVHSHIHLVNFYGEKSARLSSDQSVFTEMQHEPTMLISAISPLLFFAPDVHLRHLRHVWNDHVVTERLWRRFIDRLQVEWDKFILPATVLLSANVAFLAIPSVDQTNQTPDFFSIGNGSFPDVFKHFDFNMASPQRTSVQIASYISAVVSVASIMLGMILDRYHRSSQHLCAQDAAHLLQINGFHRYGLEIMAILYSLPYALLMWGMISFAAACGLLFFEGTTDTTRMPLAVICALCLLAVVWSTYVTWDWQHPWIPQILGAMRRPEEDETGFDGKARDKWFRFISLQRTRTDTTDETRCEP